MAMGDLARSDEYGPQEDPWGRAVRAASDIEGAPLPQGGAIAPLPRRLYGGDNPTLGGTIGDIGNRMYDLAYEGAAPARVPGNVLGPSTLFPNREGKFYRKPEVENQWSDWDQEMAQHNQDLLDKWGAQTAFSDVFWPFGKWGTRGAVTSGAGSKIIQPENPRARIGGNEPPPEFKMTPEEINPPTARITVHAKPGMGDLASTAAEVPPVAAIPTYSEWAQGLPKPRPAAKSTDIPDIRGMPVDQAIEIARRQPHLIEGGEGTAGKYVGGQRDVQSKRDLTAIRKAYDEYVGADPRGWDWYNLTRPAINLSTGGDPQSNQWAGAQHGQFSAGVDPNSELHFVLKELNASIAGMPVKAARPAQHEAHMEAVRTGDIGNYQLGDKTRKYAEEVTRGLPGGLSLIPGATGVTDFRNMRQWGFTEPGGAPQKEGAGPATHKFVDMETALAVDRANKMNLGGKSDWTGEQLQAAPWVRQKALDIMERNPKLTYEEAFKRANTTIADAYPTKTYNATYEAQPGRNTGHLPQSVGAPLDERLAYFNDLRSRWGTAPMGRDAIYAGLGTPGTGNRMRVLPTEQMTGMYQPPGQDPTGNPFPLEQNPGEIARPMGTFRTPPEGKPKDFIGPEEFHPYKQATPADRAILDAGEHLRAALDAQDAGSWHKWWQGGPAWQNNSLFFPRSAAGPGKMGDLLSLQGTGAPYGVPDVTDSMQGALMTRFYPHRDFLPGAEDKTFNQAIKQKVFSNAAGNLGLEPPIRVRVDSNLANLVDEWKQGEGSGAVTRKVLDYVTKTPEMRVAFNANPYLPERALAKFERDKDWAGKWGAPRQDIQTLREVIGDSKGDWIDRLEQALRDKSISLPAVAALLAGTAALAHAPGQEDRGGL